MLGLFFLQFEVKGINFRKIVVAHAESLFFTSMRKGSQFGIKMASDSGQIPSVHNVTIYVFKCLLCNLSSFNSNKTAHIISTI